MIEMSGGRSAVIRPVSGDVLALFFQRVVMLDSKSLRDVRKFAMALRCKAPGWRRHVRTDEQIG